jgi:hypothetical protein
MIVLYLLIGIIGAVAVYGGLYLLGRLAIYIVDLNNEEESKWRNTDPMDRPPVAGVGIFAAIFLILAIGLFALIGKLIFDSIAS